MAGMTPIPATRRAAAPLRVPVTGWAGLVALGSAVGTLVRAALEGAFPPAPGAFPWTTFLINVLGSFLLGALQETLALTGPDSGVRKVLRIGVGTGVIGGFTTYSTFVLEGERLLSQFGAGALVGVVYVLVSVLCGLVAALAGFLAAGAVVRWREGRRGRGTGTPGPAGAGAGPSGPATDGEGQA